jgi:hypothetical protein
MSESKAYNILFGNPKYIGYLVMGYLRNSYVNSPPGLVCFPTLCDVMRRVSPLGKKSGDLNMRKGSDQIEISEVTLDIT